MQVQEGGLHFGSDRADVVVQRRESVSHALEGKKGLKLIEVQSPKVRHKQPLLVAITTPHFMQIRWTVIEE